MNQTGNSEKPARSPVLSGVVVAVITLFGVDCVVGAGMAHDRLQKSARVAVRTLAPSGASILARVPSLTWAAGALALLLLLRRPTLADVPCPAGTRMIPSAPDNWPVLLLRRKTSISYHIGGPLGP